MVGVAMMIVLTGAVGGYWEVGAKAAMLAFVLAATIEAPNSQLGSREIGWLLGAQPPVLAQSLPTTLSDKEFWAIVDGFSEAGGTFASDNIISNEIAFQHVLPELKRTGQEGVYLGVGPEQNFTYIAAIRPKMA